MNMFRNGPESLGGLAGCFFWIVFFAAATALFLKALLSVAGLVA